jgi:cold shock CspA family protein
MRGKMIWFNPEKGFGYIRTEEDERLYVAADGFAEGHDPHGRCGGRDVVFERVDQAPGEPRAADVQYVVVQEPHRARLRRSR